jgi:hypothetical protein
MLLLISGRFVVVVALEDGDVLELTRVDSDERLECEILFAEPRKKFQNQKIQLDIKIFKY